MEERNSMYDIDLPKNEANFIPLSPISFLKRCQRIYPEQTAVIHGNRSYNYAEFYTRCRQLASALVDRGIRRGDTVAILAPNTPPMLEAHYAVPGIGAVLNPLNVRLDAETIAFILRHSEAKLLLVDSEYEQVTRDALNLLDRNLQVVDIKDAEGFDDRLGEIEYEDLLASGNPDFELSLPSDEWDAFILSYTSGTTGDPKGVVYHHRGAYINALANVAAWSLPNRPVYLWTLPIFHSLGWCFPWTLSLLAGTHVCLRKADPTEIYRLIQKHGVTHMCGAPIVMSMLANAREGETITFPQTVKFMTAASAPPAAVIERMEMRGFEIQHVYGMTEVFGPSTICEWKPSWDTLGTAHRAALKARQGVAYPSVEDVAVMNPDTLTPVPADGQSMGEVMMRSNTVMRGYLRNPKATEAAFAGGWFHSGDLAVMHPDGYLEIRDRSKDIIISGGENISTIEVEGVLYRHPSVQEVAVVARPDETWGESPCAFVSLREGTRASSEELIEHCRSLLAHYKCPRTVVFGSLPKTSTGKIQKFVLRERAKALRPEEPGVAD